jgi:branched-chain amino acid transport system ATP-binding protein
MLMGPNGSGKTTLVNVVSGFYSPDSGSVKLNGIEITGWQSHEVYRAGIARTFQIPAPFLRLTTLENMLVEYRDHPGESFLAAYVKGAWSREEEEAVKKAFSIIDMLNLDEVWEQPSSTLSGGQMKLLEIGRALMGSPIMVLMDEPVAGVNPTLAYEVLSHIRKLRDKLGLTFILIEHRHEIVLPYIDYVFAMARGRVVSEGLPDSVMNDPIVIESYLGGRVAEGRAS